MVILMCVKSEHWRDKAAWGEAYLEPNSEALHPCLQSSVSLLDHYQCANLPSRFLEFERLQGGW
jgi:hypothetical protein